MGTDGVTHHPDGFDEPAAGGVSDVLANIVKADWSVKVFPTGGAIPPLETFPGDDLAAWEAADVSALGVMSGGVPAVWGVPTDEGPIRVMYADLVDPTRSGVYVYTPGVSFVRADDVSTTAELHGRYVSARLNRHHSDNSLVTQNAWGFIPNVLYFTANDPTAAMGTVSWQFTLMADLTTLDVFFSYLTGITGLSFTPVSGDWTGADPTTLADAVNRIAATLGPIA